MASGWRAAELEHHVGAPALAGDPRAPPVLPAQVGEDGQQIVGEGGEVVAVVGLVRLAVAPLVDGGDRVAGGGEAAGHPVPEPGVRRQPVHEQHGDRPAPRDRWSGRGA